MTKRFYYTDALAAAWMAKHFGMSFVSATGEPIKYCHIERCYYTDSHIIEWDKPFYIRHDSLSLLEPKLNDVCQIRAEASADKQVFMVSDKTAVFEQSYGLDKAITIYQEVLERLEEFGIVTETFAIIQRNGIAFMWPESE